MASSLTRLRGSTFEAISTWTLAVAHFFKGWRRDGSTMIPGQTMQFEGTWDGVHIIIRGSHLWVDATGDLRMKTSAPTSDLDGVVVGTQT